MIATDFKLPLPATVILGILMSAGTYLVGTHTSEGILTSRVDQMEKSLIAEQIILQGMTSRNEFQIFREEQNSRLADVLSRLKDIDSKVSK